jgi:hypothetical protein
MPHGPMSEGSNGASPGNGSGNGAEKQVEDGLAPAPKDVEELAEACVTYVERETKVRLDYTPETLPLVDHWLRERKLQVGAEKDEIVALVAAPVGAYLGEVLRRRYALQWFAPPGEYRRWRVEFEHVFLSTNPIGAAVEAILEQEAEGWGAELRMRPEDEPIARAALDKVGEMDVEEYFAPSTRVEAIEIVVDTLLPRAEEGEVALPRYGAKDYGALRTESIAEGEVGGGKGN